MNAKTFKIIRKYAKLTKLPYKFIFKAFEHGTRRQRETDLFAMRATIMVMEANQKEKLTVEKQNELIDNWIAKQKYVPGFFKTPLPTHAVIPAIGTLPKRKELTKGGEDERGNKDTGGNGKRTIN